MVKSSASMPVAVNPKPNSKMDDKTNEMIGYFNALPAANRAQLLISLHDYDPNVLMVPAGYADRTFPHPPKLIPLTMRRSKISSTKKPRPRKHSRRLILPVNMVG